MKEKLEGSGAKAVYFFKVYLHLLTLLFRLNNYFRFYSMTNLFRQLLCCPDSNVKVEVFWIISPGMVTVLMSTRDTSDKETSTGRRKFPCLFSNKI